jgi:2,4-dienoyl-CoA reductase-like NADH-dependent reductase (Old Yellow Enzyme family)
MSILFEPQPIGKMIVKNRLVRSATVEKMATDDGPDLNKKTPEGQE